jgi:selenocysteine-specific elongation factor
MTARRYVVIATAGHIDHGKSALVRALTGVDPDRLKEEKERGITIELGFAHATIGDTTVAFVDVPGHERFVRTMLAGVGGVDAVMLVVAADESVMPQTREHFDICRLLHVSRGLVALTKSDLVDSAMLDVATLEVKELVAGSFLHGAPIIPVSAKTGAGLDALRDVLVGLSEHSRAQEPHGARLPIDRVFSMTGFGTVVTGTLQGGPLHVEDEVLLLPGERRVRVRGLQIHGRPNLEALAGQRVALNLSGVDIADVARGQTLAMPNVLSATTRLDVEIDLLATARPLEHGQRVRFHTGTADAFGRLVMSAGVREIPTGQRGLARLRLQAPVVVTRHDRFILRSASAAMTIAGGRVLDPDPALTSLRQGSGAQGAPRSSQARQRLEILAGRGDDQELAALAMMVSDRGAKGLPVGKLVSRGGVAPSRVDDVVSRLESAHAIVRADDVLVSAATVSDLSTRLLTIVGELHAKDPLAEGLPREEARERLFARASPAVFARVLSELRDRGTLIVRDRLALSSHQAGLSSDEQRAQTVLAQRHREARLTPPDVTAIAAEAGLQPSVITRMLELMVRQKTLVRIGGLVFHPDVLMALKEDVQRLKSSASASATVDVAMFKQRYGVSRKFAIPLLEWLDRERVTRRVGDVRVVL